MDVLVSFCSKFLLFYPIILSVSLIFIKTTNLCKCDDRKHKKIENNILIIIYSLVISFIGLSLNLSNGMLLAYIILFVTLSMFMLFMTKSKNMATIPIIIISICTPYIIRFFCEIIVGTICFLIKIDINNLFAGILLDIVFIVIITKLTSIKRFKKSLNYLSEVNNFGIGMLISGFVLSANIIIYSNIFEHNAFLFLLIGFVISIIGLVFWIKKTVKDRYINKLQGKEKIKHHLDLHKKEIELESLSYENTSLSSIIHLDNHIIQSIETELNKLNNSKLTDKLLISINQRNEYVNDTLIKSKNLPSTGSVDIDAVLADLYIKAASRGIDFNLNTDCDINYLINNIITNNDFEALLRELITNSIIAVENNPKITGRISINISQPNDIYELTVMDNGSFIDNNSIPDTIEKSKASITTNHFENNDSFTKSVTIRFDGLNMSERIFSKQRHTI